MAPAVYSGGCLCGAVRYEVRGPARNPCWCHCTSCRRAVGAPAVPWASFDNSGFRLSRGSLTEYASSPPVRRGFCAACGAALTYRHTRRTADVDLTLATLDAAAELPPRMHIWVQDKLPWIVLGDGLPIYPAGVPD
ncbi:MAG: GFA family protein [Gammaproteobacteria bacterium]|nr:GFA family protein [Gammaproteobacteria bacterium]MBV9619825.1 GFA family protein [Gammaproteobacteria bacterium]